MTNSNPSSRPLEFWRWFAANQARFRSVEGPSKEALLDELGEHLEAYCAGLFFEIGGTPGGTTELIITAEGRRSLFGAVRELIASAPVLDGWELIAFKPAQGSDFVTNYEGARVDPKACWFLPLESPSDPERLGLRVGCPTFDPSLRRDFGNAMLIVLDTVLGELRAADEIGYVEVVELCAAPAEEGFIELPELPQYLDWWKSKRAAKPPARPGAH